MNENENENDSTTTESDNHPASADGGAFGRWVTDPDDPNFEIWEPARVESKSVDPSKRVVEWSDGRTPDPSKICTARRSDGTPCRKQRVTGAVVCTTHGGRAPQVVEKARVRLQMAGDRLAKELLRIAIDDPEIPSQVKLAAVRDALSRVGITEKRALEVEVDGGPAFRGILDAIMTGGSRAESRSQRGAANTAPPEHDWIAEELGVIDAEVVDEPPTPPFPAPRPTPFSPAPNVPTQASGSGLMDYSDALDILRSTAPPPQAPAPRRNRRS